MPADLVVRSQRVVLPGGERPAALVISGGRIRRIVAHGARVAARAELDAGGLALLPGLVDTHVHVNEPGRTEWEGFASATRAAAAGGITTLVDMPLNSIPAVTDWRALETKRRAAAGQVTVDVGFWGGLVAGNAAELEALHAAGVRGFKAFLVDSGVPEFPAASESDLALALPILARRGAPLLVHAEDPAVIAAAAAAASRRSLDPTDPAGWLASRPAAAEEAAVRMLIRLARRFRAHIHVVHVACEGAVELIRAARRDGVPITAESCPHYLHFCAADVPRRGCAWKCAPPIREAAHREALWAGLDDGTLDLVASDHSPSPPSMKAPATGRFDQAWGGIASLQLALSVTWTGCLGRGFGLGRLAGWMAERPARLAGLAGRKGVLAPGADADFLLFDPDGRFKVDPARLYHRHSLTPYAGLELAGVVEQTFVRGRRVFGRGRPFGPPAGRLL